MTKSLFLVNIFFCLIFNFNFEFETFKFGTHTLPPAILSVLYLSVSVHCVHCMCALVVKLRKIIPVCYRDILYLFHDHIAVYTLICSIL